MGCFSPLISKKTGLLDFNKFVSSVFKTFKILIQQQYYDISRNM